jgi:hypothetical protein
VAGLENEKLRSRLETEQNFHEVQSFVEDAFCDRMTRRKLTTAFVDPIINLNMHLLRSKKIEAGEKVAATSTESEALKKLAAEVEELRKANETQKKLQLKLEVKVRMGRYNKIFTAHFNFAFLQIRRKLSGT